MEEHAIFAAGTAASGNNADDDGQLAELAFRTPGHQSLYYSPQYPAGRHPPFPRNTAVDDAVQPPDVVSFLNSYEHPVSPSPAASNCSTVNEDLFKPKDSMSGLHSKEVTTTHTNSLADVVVSRQAFLSGYVNMLLPVLKRIHSENVATAATLDERLSAVKLAADMSLVVSTGSHSGWSQALLREILISPRCRLVSHPSKAGSRGRKPGKKFVLKKTKVKAACGFHLASMKRSKGTPGGCLGTVARSPFSQCGRVVPACNSLSQSGNGLLQDLGNGFPLSARASSRRKARPEQYRHRKSRMCMSRRGLSSYLKALRVARTNTQAQASTLRHLSHEPQQRGPRHHHNGHQQSGSITTEQIESLGELVPGGRAMDVPLLLEEAADYIVTLQMQVEALQCLSRSLERS